VPLRGKEVSKEIREIIVRQLTRVTFEKSIVSRMVLHFKPDKKNTIHFLYCTSMRLEEEKNPHRISSSIIPSTFGRKSVQV